MAPPRLIRKLQVDMLVVLASSAADTLAGDPRDAALSNGRDAEEERQLTMEERALNREAGGQ